MSDNAVLVTGAAGFIGFHVAQRLLAAGRNVVGLLLDDSTDWEELRELLTDSYCLQAPRRLARLVHRPTQRAPGSAELSD